MRDVIRLAALLTLAGAILACGFGGDDPPSSMPSGTYEGVMTTTRYRPSGAMPESGASATVTLDGASTLTFQYFSVTCTGHATRVGDQIVLSSPSCSDPSLPGCVITSGQLTFGVGAPGIGASDTLEMRAFTWAYADAPACVERVAERQEFQPATLQITL